LVPAVSTALAPVAKITKPKIPPTAAPMATLDEAIAVAVCSTGSSSLGRDDASTTMLVGGLEGDSEISWLGPDVGSDVGPNVGSDVEMDVGCVVGAALGLEDGIPEGAVLGFQVGAGAKI